MPLYEEDALPGRRWSRRVWCPLAALRLLCDDFHCLLLQLVASAATPPQLNVSTLATPPQLNVSAFASCLLRHGGNTSTPEEPPDLPTIKRRYNFSLADGLLIYLALYPSQRLPIINSSVQEAAFERWSAAFDSETNHVAAFLRLHDRTPHTFTPGAIYAQSRAVCGDAFCAALVMHNTLRTLGRYYKFGSYLPGWWRKDPAGWTAAAKSISPRILSLRRAGGGETYGPIYHLSGILAYAIHERALLGRVPGNLVTELVARLNSLVGPPEEPVKHEIDEEAADVGVHVVDGKAGAGIGWGEACKARAGYVLPPAL